MHKGHLTYVIGCLAFLAFVATQTGCARTVTVRDPSEAEMVEKREAAASANKAWANVYWQKMKANFCRE